MAELQALGNAIASQIRKYRLRKNLSIRQLSEECQKLGAAELTTASLANIERGQDPNAKRAGRRVAIEELVVLARVLNVPPILLVFPLGSEQWLEITGVKVHTWAAAMWWSGEEVFPHGPLTIETMSEWDVTAAPVIYFRRHSALVTEYQHLPRAKRAEVVRRREEIEAMLQELRQNMRRAGIDPGELPEGLAHIEPQRHKEA